MLVQSGGVAGASITGVTGSGDTYTVTASTGSGNGALGLNLSDNDSIIDAGGNSLRASGGGVDGSFTGQVYTIDKTAPSVTSTRLSARPIRRARRQIHFTAVFSEPSPVPERRRNDQRHRRGLETRASPIDGQPDVRHRHQRDDDDPAR